MKRTVLTMVMAVAVAGCLPIVQRKSTGIVPIGSDAFMLSSSGGDHDYFGGEIKADLYKEAQQYCAKTGKSVAPVNSTANDSGIGTYASAEIQFKCQ